MRYYMYVARPGSCVLVRANEITSVMPLREVAGYAIRVISAEGPRYGQRASARLRYFRNETLGCVYGPDTKRRKK